MYIDRTCLVTKWLNSKWVKSNCELVQLVWSISRYCTYLPERAKYINLYMIYTYF